MISYFESLFSIDCHHNYYTDSVCPDLQIDPTDECKKNLRSHKLLFRSQKNGANIIIEKKNVGTEAAPDLKSRIPITPDTVFTFSVSLRNNDFLNLTHIEPDQMHASSVFLFSGNLSRSDETEAVEVKVHHGDLPVPVQAVGRVFRHTINANAASAINICGESDHLLFQNPLLPAQGAINIDMHGYPEGVYKIRTLDNAGGLLEQNTVFVSGATSVPQLFAFVQIKYTDEILGQLIPRHAFSLDFEARSIHWEYQVKVKEIESGDPSNLDPNALQLEGGPVVFNSTVTGVTSDIVLIQSADEIPLREKPYTGIQLQEVTGIEPDVQKEILIKHMPNPEIHRLTNVGDNLKSEMRLTVK